MTMAALSSSTVETFNSLKRNSLYAALSRNISAVEPRSPKTTSGLFGRQYVSFIHCCNFKSYNRSKNYHIQYIKHMKWNKNRTILSIWYEEIWQTWSCVETLNHFESTWSQKISSIGLPVEYNWLGVNSTSANKFSPLSGKLKAPNFSSGNFPFSDSNSCTK